jgi:hypothetical protein
MDGPKQGENRCEIPRKGHSLSPPLRHRHALSIREKEVAMSTILKCTLGRAATIVAIAGLAVTAVATSASAGPAHQWNHGNWNHGYHQWDHRWDHARWYGGGGYGPRYYAAPPVIYPQPYYGPPSLNFNIPLG